MGLAASQARLLTITSRKADCEFQSMMLSHQKLALSRNMEDISSDYQSALTKTKLVYNNSAIADSKMDLTYGLLMNPSIYNDYSPKLVTDSKNRVILSSQYAYAARLAGIPAEGLSSTPSTTVRDKFINALYNAGVIDYELGSIVIGEEYNNQLGLGATSNGRVIVGGLTDIEGLTQLIYDNCDGTIAWAQKANEGVIPIGAEMMKRISSDKDAYLKFILKAGDETLSIKPGSTKELFLEDLLTKEVTYGVKANEDATGTQLEKNYNYIPVLEMAEMQKSLVNFTAWMDEQFSAILGNVGNNNAALNYAYNQVLNLVKPDNNLQDAASYVLSRVNGIDWGTDYAKKNECLNEVSYEVYSKGYLDSVLADLKMVPNSPCEPEKYLGIVCNRYVDQEEAKCSLSNLAKVYLTSFIEYLQTDAGEDSSYKWQKGKTSDCKLFDLKNKDYTFEVFQGIVDEEQNSAYSRFYDMMFNMICTQGWVQNDYIDNKDYLGELLKNGQAYISSLSGDGFYYQSQVSNDQYMMVVTDDKEIARAEAKYNQEKARVESKEQSLDLKLKNLSTEISSLNQEYESVKNLVTKSIEKSFKRYEA